MIIVVVCYFDKSIRREYSTQDVGLSSVSRIVPRGDGMGRTSDEDGTVGPYFGVRDVSSNDSSTEADVSSLVVTAASTRTG